MNLLGHVGVVEVADGLGSAAGSLLAQLGARVTKVEAPGGDESRRVAPFAPDDAETGIAWRVAQAGKALAMSDPATAAGRDALAGLIDAADILLLGGPAGRAEALLDAAGLGGADRRAERWPRLIEVSVAGFAEGAPQAGDPVSDLTLMAMSGIVHTVGEPGRPPLTLPGGQAYALAGTQAVTGALLALHARARTGRGQRVVVSAYQSAVLAGYRDPIVWEWTGRLGARTGNRLVRGRSGVRQVWACRDGFVTWSLVDNPAMVKGLVALMRQDGLAGPLADIDWDNTLLAEADQARIDAWEAAIEPFFLAHSRDELARWSEERALGLSPIEQPDAVLAEPHWHSRGFWTEAGEFGTGRPVLIPAAPFRFEPGAAPVAAEPAAAEPAGAEDGAGR